MEEKIIVLNVNKYQKDGQDRSRLGFIFADNKKVSNTDKFRGLAELSIYYDSTIAFDNVPIDVIGQISIATIESKPSPTNPLKDRRVITKLVLEKNGKSYSLV